jgi:hypothetical protein
LPTEHTGGFGMRARAAARSYTRAHKRVRTHSHVHTREWIRRRRFSPRCMRETKKSTTGKRANKATWPDRRR